MPRLLIVALMISYIFRVELYYANSRNEIVAQDLVTDHSEQNSTIQNKDMQDVNFDNSVEGRLSACEQNYKNLLNRVEELEHLVKQSHNSNLDKLNNEPKSTDGNQAVSNNSNSISSNERKDYDIALAALKESRFDDAENLFSKFMQNYPNSELVSNAYFWYADSFFRRGDFDKAAINYLKGYKQYPKAPKAPDNLLKLALSLGELKKFKDACAMLNKLEVEYKNRPASSIKRAGDAKLKYCK